jgi:formylglycine-generating enzyme required for sulfatase activity
LAACNGADEQVVDFLIGTIASCPDRIEECKNYIDALRPVATSLPAKWSQSRDDSVSDEWWKIDARDEAAPKKRSAARARFATVLLHLGIPEPAQDMTRLTDDPTNRTSFILGFQSWHGKFDGLAALLQQARGDDKPDTEFQSVLCAAVGTVDPNAFRLDIKGDIQKAVQALYENADADGGTHSAAGWVLRQWQVPLPSLPQQKRSSKPWFVPTVNDSHITMIRILPGKFLMGDQHKPNPLIKHATVHQVTLTRPFYMADREVTVELFQRFINDPTYPAAEKRPWDGPNEKYLGSPPDDYPVQTVSWIDAVLFCNWLSKQEGLPLCYQRSRKHVQPMPEDKDSFMHQILEDDDDVTKAEPWDFCAYNCDFTAPGYRLPTEAEWEYACRAGTITDYYFGDDDLLLHKYAVYYGGNYADKGKTQPGGGRLPNGWGLFDMHGNVWEWCWDRWDGKCDYQDGPLIDPDGSPSHNDQEFGEHGRVYRGGAWFNRAGAGRSPDRGGRKNWPTVRMRNVGFRVVCTAANP